MRLCYFTALFALSLVAAPPNIVLIMTDDMGYSDLGCYGSEIETPNIDRLARRGLRFTQFYNAGRCCPTRASLMTGLYAHQAGMGGMTSDTGKPGYRGRLMPNCVTIAEVLKPAGYLSIQTGKWHLGADQESWWPRGRGFHHSFSSPAGGGFYFRPSTFYAPRFIVRDGKTLYTKTIDPPKGWYTTDAYTEEGLSFIKKAVADQQPFFWYCAYNAPHWPLKAKPADIAKYRGRYRIGWDTIRQQRHERLVKSGMLDANSTLSPRAKKVPAWDSLSDAQKDEQDLRMATYAAMIDCIDQNVGKIVSSLHDLNILENTLILFLHDNGGDLSGGVLGANKGKGECGTAESFAYYGECWANVSNAPFREYKTRIHEGGISTPLIAHWPAGISKPGRFVRPPAHVIDIMATCADFAAATYPKTHNGHDIVPLEGKSLRPVFANAPFERGPLFFEHQGNRGIRDERWKLVTRKGGKWELYDMQADRTELHNRAKEFPERVHTLSAQYQHWAERAQVTNSKRK
ncbi:MAG: arylsulfatase A-like enzyme [Rhodothermales bacterium]|jgi:arylsulfatase A-like enzyme